MRSIFKQFKLIKTRAIEIFWGLITPGQVRFKDIWPKINQVEGLLAEGQEEWLFKAAKSLSGGARILEIGCFKGRSTVSLAYGCLGTRKQVFTIDKFKGIYQDVENRQNLKDVFEKGFYEEWKRNIERNGLGEYVVPFMGDSRALSRIWTASINMLFIDGSHKFEDVMDDFNNFFPYVAPNGIIAIHDVMPEWEGPYRAWHKHIKYKLNNIGKIAILAYGRKPS